MNQSYLPEDREEETIGRMLVGDRGYIVSWAIQPDEDRRLWIRTDYTISNHKGGTAHILIERKKTGFVAYRHSLEKHDKWKCHPLDPKIEWLPINLA